MARQTVEQQAAAAVELAKAAKAEQCAAVIERSREVTVEWRDGKPDRVSEATSLGLTLRLFVDGRYSVAKTSDLRPEALKPFVADSVALARALAKDPFRSLADPALYPTELSRDLRLADPGYEKVTPAQRREVAQALEAAVRAAPTQVELLSVSSYAGDVDTETCLVTSNGFSGSTRRTSFYRGTDVSARDADGRRPEEGAHAVCRLSAELPPIDALAQDALQRVTARLGARKLPTRKGTMLVENRAGGRLVSFLLGPLYGPALQQSQSCFKGKVGQAIGSAALDLADDPLIERGLGSRLFDSEGLAAARHPLFEKGVLRGYLLDTYYAKKLALAPTTGETSNLSWKLGDRSGEQLRRGVKEGVLVTGFLGGNSNTTTGDFSVGVQGFRIRNGERAEPISEMNVAGNHLTFWKQLSAVGNDPWLYSTGRSPTLQFDGVQVVGA